MSVRVCQVFPHIRESYQPLAHTLTDALSLVAHLRSARAVISLDAQESFECASIVQIENRIDDRIEAGIDVAQPGDEVLELVCGTAALAERQNHVHEKEGQPADDKHAHDDAQRAGSPSLLGQRDLLFLLNELIHSARLLLQCAGCSDTC